MGDPVKVLIVDDDLDTLKLLDVVLSNAGFVVLHAANGREAVELLDRGVPALVLCDVLMPEMDGYDTLLHIRNHPLMRNLPVLMLSALGQEKDVQRALRSGANGYIIKPFSLRGLMAEVRKFIPVTP